MIRGVVFILHIKYEIITTCGVLLLSRKRLRMKLRMVSEPGNINSLPHISEFNNWWWTLWKTLWEKEKMLVISIFSISLNCFHLSKNKLRFLIFDIYFIGFRCFLFCQVLIFVILLSITQKLQIYIFYSVFHKVIGLAVTFWRNQLDF